MNDIENEFMLIKAIHSSISNYFYCVQGYPFGESLSRIDESYRNHLIDVLTSILEEKISLSEAKKQLNSYDKNLRRWNKHHVCNVYTTTIKQID